MQGEDVHPDLAANGKPRGGTDSAPGMSQLLPRPT
jgi:hypothetical protein